MTIYKVIIETPENLPDGTPLCRDFSVRGAVTDDKGMPVPNASVRIIEPDINDIGEGITDAAGKFTVVVKEDTMHHVFVNECYVCTVKILVKGIW